MTESTRTENFDYHFGVGCTERLHSGVPMMPAIDSSSETSRFSAAIFWIRLPVGLIFFTQGLLKFLDPNLGVNRFARIGFPHPYLTAHFVGVFEIACGALVLVGLRTRSAAIPLLVVIATAIATTKLPELFRVNQGFWFMVSDARTDFAMFCSLIFLIVAGGGSYALDGR